MKIIDYEIKEVGGLEIQNAEPEVNINECFSLWFKDYNNNQITIHLSYDNVLEIIKLLEPLKNEIK